MHDVIVSLVCLNLYGSRCNLSRAHESGRHQVENKIPQTNASGLDLHYSRDPFYEAKEYPEFNESLISLGYIGTFLAGMLYAYGFTSTPATVILLILAGEQNIFLAGLIGGTGALLSDLIIYLFVRNMFADEIERLQSRSIFFRQGSNKQKNAAKKYLLLAAGGFLVASPLPAEIGVTLIASVKDLSVRKFLVIAYLLHTTGIFAILLTGSAIS